jgi:hypothetical protein
MEVVITSETSVLFTRLYGLTSQKTSSFQLYLSTRRMWMPASGFDSLFLRTCTYTSVRYDSRRSDANIISAVHSQQSSQIVNFEHVAEWNYHCMLHILLLARTYLISLFFISLITTYCDALHVRWLLIGWCNNRTQTTPLHSYRWYNKKLLLTRIACHWAVNLKAISLWSRCERFTL